VAKGSICDRELLDAALCRSCFQIENFGEFESKKRSARWLTSCCNCRAQRQLKGYAVRIVIWALTPFLLSSFTANAADHVTLQPGSYEVGVRLELPHVEDMGFSKTAVICVNQTGTHGLTVLSDNNPLVRCPASDVQEDGDTLTFDLICEGHNQAVARAKFSLRGDHFDGAFDMKMGGKNMTMTEQQTGHRTGPCPEAPRP
jgi:hypothetical protein